ncbi:MAG: hypothetical protein KJZ80_01220 [Hyphomicrobiaceae bacterium]|nr:hypothetical protein [Hyphomicrobiaceae bacterium]
MLKIAALTAASFGLAVSAHAQAQQPSAQAEQMCQQIWQQADAQKQGFVTGQQAQRMSQAIQTAQASPGAGGAAGGAPGTKAQPGGTNGATAERVTQQQFMSACERSPQSFQHLRS